MQQIIPKMISVGEIIHFVLLTFKPSRGGLVAVVMRQFPWDFFLRMRGILKMFSKNLTLF
jgi:hypothetical protein